MDIVYIISRYSSANRSAKTHINNGNGKPLCNEKPRGKTNGWSQDSGDVTCEKYLSIIAAPNRRLHKDPPSACTEGGKNSDPAGL